MIIEPTLSRTIRVTMTALAITMTALSLALIFGVFATTAMQITVALVLAVTIGFNLALVCVSIAERYTLHRHRQQAHHGSV